MVFSLVLLEKSHLFLLQDGGRPFFNNERTEILRTAPDDEQIEEGGFYILKGNLFEVAEEEVGGREIIQFGLNVKNPGEFAVGEEVEFREDFFTIAADGSYTWKSSDPIKSSRGRRIYVTISVPPVFTLDNYREVLSVGGINNAFINSFTVAIPATFIPILIAAFAAYCLAWMNFRGKVLILMTIIGLLVVPLQMSLIPVLKFYNQFGGWFGIQSKSYVGIWLAHTGFGLPLAIYLLYNYISSLPKEIIESAKMDGADHLKIFVRIILPLSVPALASFAIFQFLWVWNDLLVAIVFLAKSDDQIVLTSALKELLGSRGGNWEILTASAFVTIIVPITVFLVLQRYFVRGLLSGSVK